MLARKLYLCYYIIAKQIKEIPCCARAKLYSFEPTLMNWEPDFRCGVEALSSVGPAKHVRRHPPVGRKFKTTAQRHGGVIFYV